MSGGGAMLVVFIPALAMCAGSLSVLCFRINDTFQAAMQNFSAGILLGAIAGELFPILQNVHEWRGHENGDEFAGEAIGFLFGLGLMYAVKILAEKFEEDESEATLEITANPVIEEAGEGVVNQLAAVVESKQSLEEGGVPGSKDDEVAEVDRGSDLADGLPLEENMKSISHILATEPFNRDGFDKLLHELQWNADCLRRKMRGARPITQHHKERMAFHVDEMICQHAEVNRGHKLSATSIHF
jgi:hypothetical protein